MRLLFTADLHIKLGQKSVPIQWQIDRYMRLADLLNNIDADILVLGGDTFDRLPTIEELELYFAFIGSLNKRTLIFDGNHEATKSGKTFLSNLRAVTSKVNPNVEIVDAYTQYEDFDVLPYCELKNINNIQPTSKLLLTHVRGEVPPHVKPEIDLALLERWETVLAGDLHSHSNCQRNILYPGTPLVTSFHRQLSNTGVILMDTNSLKWEFIATDLPQLLRKTVSRKEDMVRTDYHHTVYEYVGTLDSTSSVEKSDLLDKKITLREYSPSLDISGKTLLEELEMYLRSILKVENADELIGIANGYIRTTELD